MENKQLLGAWGEMQAVDHLRTMGDAILACNYRCRLGEIDIIAKNREYLAFVEVKLRKSSAYGEAKEFVDRRKQARIRMTAELWLSEHETALQPRFDVIEVYAPEGEKTARPVIRHWENAFV